MASYADRRAAALQKLGDMAMARQKFLDEMYRRSEEQAMAEQNVAAEQERSGKLNWFDDAAKGASMGSAFGPWGALVGGIAGTAKGQVEAYKQRRSEGQGFGSSLLSTVGDTPFGFNLGEGITSGGKHWSDDNYASLGGETLGNLMQAGGGAYKGYMADKARESSALQKAPGVTPPAAYGQRSFDPETQGPSAQFGQTDWQGNPVQEDSLNARLQRPGPLRY